MREKRRKRRLGGKLKQNAKHFVLGSGEGGSSPISSEPSPFPYGFVPFASSALNDNSHSQNIYYWKITMKKLFFPLDKKEKM